MTALMLTAAERAMVLATMWGEAWEPIFVEDFMAEQLIAELLGWTKESVC